jgi:hypothetical protein
MLRSSSESMAEGDVAAGVAGEAADSTLVRFLWAVLSVIVLGRVVESWDDKESFWVTGAFRFLVSGGVVVKTLERAESRQPSGGREGPAMRGVYLLEYGGKVW